MTMSAFSRGARLSSGLISLFQKRCICPFSLKPIRSTHNLYGKCVTNVICKRKIPGFRQQITRQFETLAEKRGLRIIRELNKIVDSGLNLYKEDIQRCFKLVDMAATLTPQNAASLIKFTGKCLYMESLEEKKKLVFEAVNIVEEKVKFDVHIFNALAKVYAENEMQLECQNILSAMAEKGVAPNKDTYLILLRIYCVEGNMNLAREILNIINQKKYIQTIGMYNSLLIGFINSKNDDGFLKLVETMKETNVTLNKETYGILLRSYALSDPDNGLFDPDKLKELLDYLRHSSFLFTPQELMDIIRPLLENKDELAANKILQHLPRGIHIETTERDVKAILEQEGNEAFLYNPSTMALFFDIFKLDNLNFMESQGITTAVIIDRPANTEESRNLADFLDCFYKKDFKQFEDKLLEMNADNRDQYQNDFHVLSCLVQYFSVHKQDLETAKKYWDKYKPALLLAGDRIAMAKQYGFGKLSKVFRNISMQPVVDYSILLIKKDRFAEVQKVLEFAEKIPKKRMDCDIVNFYALLQTCLCHNLGKESKIRTYDLTSQIEAITEKHQNHAGFICYLIEKYPTVVMDYWFFCLFYMKRVSSQYEIYTFLIKEQKFKALEIAYKSLKDKDQTGMILPPVTLAAAYIINGNSSKAKFHIKELGFGKGISENDISKMNQFEGFCYNIAQTLDEADMLKENFLEEIIHISEELIPLELQLRLNLCLANVYAVKELFHEATAVLEMCKEKDTDGILIQLSDRISKVHEKFGDHPFTVEYKLDEIKMVADHLAHPQKLIMAEDWILEKASAGKIEMLEELMKELVKRNDIDSIFSVGRMLRHQGNPECIISLCSVLSEAFPRYLMEGWRKYIPFAHYHKGDIKVYMSRIENNDDSVDSTEITVTLMEHLNKRKPDFFQWFVTLAENKGCKHQAAICNALFCFFASSDMEKAVYYFKKIPDSWELHFMKITLHRLFIAGKIESIDTFWNLVADRLITNVYIKNRIILYYNEENMLDKVLEHVLDAADRNIKLYDATVIGIVNLFEKNGKEPPNKIFEMIDESSKYNKETDSFDSEKELDPPKWKEKDSFNSEKELDPPNGKKKVDSFNSEEELDPPKWKKEVDPKLKKKNKST